MSTRQAESGGQSGDLSHAIRHRQDGWQPSQPEVKALALHGNSLDPKVFFLGVVSDKTVELHLRIAAAKALLPYFEGRCGG